MISNCIIGIVLSIPMLVLLLQSSQRSSTYASAKEFFRFPLSSGFSLLMSFIPNAFIARISPELSQSLGKLSQNVLIGTNDSYISFLGGFAICLTVICVQYAKNILLLKETNKELLNKKVTDEVLSEFMTRIRISLSKKFADDYFSALYVGAFLILLFFFSFACGGLIAVILSFIPIIKSFRYLFKAFFILPPFLIFFAVLAFKKTKRIKMLATVCLLFSFIGAVNNYYIISHYLPHEFKYLNEDIETSVYNQKKELHDKNVDIYNYRICAFLDPEYTGKKAVACTFDLCNKIIRNFGTCDGVVTLGGYDFTRAEKSFDQSSHIYSNLWLAGYGNTDLASAIVSTVINSPSSFKTEINANALKYFIFDKGSSYVQQFTQAVNKISGLNVIRTFDFMDGCVMIEVGGVNGLCYDTASPYISNTINIEMDQLSFNVKKDVEEYRLSFTHKNNLKAKFVSGDGKITKQLDVMEDENGYILVYTRDAGEGIVTISYGNTLVDLEKVFGILVTVLFIAMIVFLIRIELTPVHKMHV
jgi:hypothetical protein